MNDDKVRPLVMHVTTVPARLPRIGWLDRQNGRAINPPSNGGIVSASAIQSQFTPFTAVLWFERHVRAPIAGRP